MTLSNTVLASIFCDAGTFCGKEDVLHAIIYYHLLQSGLSPTQVAREQEVSSNKIDLVVFDRAIRGQFNKTTILPKLAIEVKGGAYGNRNALHDEIAFDGYCRDMEKLEKEVKIGISSWFICVDMPELGRAIDDAHIQRIGEQCKRRGIAFAYYCQGDCHFFCAPVNSKGSTQPINAHHAPGRKIDVASVIKKANPLFNNMCEQLLQISGHEANTTAALYQLFRQSGASAQQLSLETYFSFAKKPGAKMHDRPDMVLFGKDYDGVFNLYKRGDRKHSNDSHKLKHIDTIFEVKGSASSNSKGDKARLQIYLDDVEKLQGWQSMAKAIGCQKLSGYFICLDVARKPLPTSAIQELFERSGDNPVVYISNRVIEISK